MEECRLNPRLLLVLGAVLSCAAVAEAYPWDENRTPGSMPYLLLGTSRGMTKFDQTSMELLEDSPYNGTMLTPLSAYYDGPIPALGEFMPTLDALNALKANSTKDIWPWIFLNRMIGYDPADPGSNPYFGAINGIDLDNATGARDDFEEIFALSLQMALELGAPGIVIDLEAYNCQNAIYHWDGLTYIRGEPQGVLVEKLRWLGRDLARLAGENYPNCTILFLFTAHDLTVTEIVTGLLEGIDQRGLGVRVINGGEMGLGYWSSSLEELRYKIEFRESATPEIFPYPDIFSLGGTIAPYLNHTGVAVWLKFNDPGIETLRDFEPFFHEIFYAYDIIWIYASGGAGYRPFDATIGPLFSAGLQEIIDNYLSYGKKGPKLVENLVGEMEKMIGLVQEIGVDVAPYIATVDGVLDLYSEGRYPEAHDLAVQMLADAEEAYVAARREQAEAVLGEAEELIGLAGEDGIDTSRHELFLARAQQSFSECNYESVVSMCEYVLTLRDEIPEAFGLAAIACLALATGISVLQGWNGELALSA